MNKVNASKVFCGADPWLSSADATKGQILTHRRCFKINDISLLRSQLFASSPPSKFKQAPTSGREKYDSKLVLLKKKKKNFWPGVLKLSPIIAVQCEQSLHINLDTKTSEEVKQGEVKLTYYYA